MSTKRTVQSLPVSTDEVFDLLGQKRRRELIRVLGSQTSPVTLFAIAGKLSQSDRDGDGIIDEEIVVMLHHVDLPRLDEAGLIRYDPAQQLVTFDSFVADVGEAVKGIESALNSVRESW